MSASSNEPEIDRQLEQLQEQAGELIPKCLFASSSRLYGELRRRARSEQRAYPYVIGTFFQMDQAQYLLDFQTMRERAVELIALLEDEERIRQIQADLSAQQYEHLVYSMSSCAYENLAEATGQLEGYNSEGLHACIADGIQVCRQTGKLGCIGCFREYACDVYTAADDAEIALHQCRQVTEHGGAWSDRGDRRWVASGKAGWLEALHSRFDPAVRLLEDALSFADEDSVSLKLEARIRTLLLLDAVLIASGLDPRLESDPVFSQMPSAEECPLFDLQLTLNRALSDAMKQDWESASSRLTPWDQRLQKCGGTHLWFETRLRLIAVKRLSGQQKQAEALAKPLEQRARTANDWLTIRRLDALMSSQPVSPLAAFHDSTLQTGTAAALQDQSSETAAAAETPAELDTVEPTPLGLPIAKLRERMTQLMDDPNEEDFLAIREQVLSYDSSQVTHFDDAASLIHLMAHLTGTAEDGEQVWLWANSIAAAHRDNGVILSVLGFLGDMLRTGPNAELAEKITADRTEQLHRKALELDGDRARNHMRAGDHYMRENNLGEAERCFARAFRLDRSLSDVVERLADIYSDTDRPRDALYVFDLSLREGCIEPRIAFGAAMTAFRLNQFEATLTYLDRYEYLEGDNLAWANYYRAVCLYETEQYEASIQSLDRAEGMAEATGWHLGAVRACSEARLGKLDEARSRITELLETPLYEVDYLSPGGIMSLLDRMLTVADDALHDTVLTEAIEVRLLQSGLMPEAWFQKNRETGTEQPEVRLYRMLVIQPLDENWAANPSRLASEADWPMYAVEWGVLAENEDSARAMAIAWQKRCGDDLAWIEELHVSEETYTDIPGVVWQGARIPWGDFDDDGDDEEEFLDEL